MPNYLTIATGPTAIEATVIMASSDPELIEAVVDALGRRCAAAIRQHSVDAAEIRQKSNTVSQSRCRR